MGLHSYRVVLMSSALCLAACGGGYGLDPSSSAVAVTQSLPPPDATTTSMDFTNYQIGPRDIVAVEVFGAPELKREVEIDASGNLSMPLIGTIAAGGKTPQVVSRAIADQLRGKYIRDPQVTLNVVKSSPKTITVDGAVQAPGVYPITGRMTLQQAIASAKGAGRIANLDQVAIFRMVNSQKMAALFSLKEIRSGRAEDPQVYGNDIVIVGEDATRRFLQDVSQFPLLGRFIPVL